MLCMKVRFERRAPYSAFHVRVLAPPLGSALAPRLASCSRVRPGACAVSAPLDPLAITSSRPTLSLVISILDTLPFVALDLVPEDLAVVI